METIETSAKGEKPTFGMVANGLKLSKVQLRALFTTIVRMPFPDDDSTPTDNVVLLLLAADLFERLPFLKPEQRTLLLTELWDQWGATESLFQHFQQVALVDGRFATWTGCTGFLDLKSGDKIVSLAHPPLETIGYNLDELYRRGLFHLKRRSAVNGHQPHDAGSMEKSGHIRLGLAGALSGPVRDGSPDMGPDHDYAGN